MKITDYISIDEFKAFQQRSTLRALMILGLNWGAIIAVFLVVYQYPNPVTVLVGLFLLAGRLQGLGVIMHECGHKSFFPQRWANQWVGQWLAAAPAFDHLESYARQHREHHRLAGTPDDPDLPNYRAYPVNRASFRRKVIRDLTGQTGVKLMAYKLGGLRGAFSSDPKERQAAMPFVHIWLVQAFILAILTVTLSPWLYLLWLGAMMTVHMLAVRLRQISEHAAVPDLNSSDPRDNTRTTYTNWFTRLWLGPNQVNYHLEHHLAAGVPAYHLKALHELLKARGAYNDTRIFKGYTEVLNHAVV
jgi:fatty acid desaturase